MREMFLFYLFGMPLLILAVDGIVTWIAVRDVRASERAREARAPAE